MTCYCILYQHTQKPELRGASELNTMLKLSDDGEIVLSLCFLLLGSECQRVGATIEKANNCFKSKNKT